MTMNIALWVAQGLLAFAFLASGTLKLITPKEKARDRMAWVDDFNEPTLKFIGAAEVLAAIGLILPAATGIAPVLTPIAPPGLAVIMALAMLVHVRRREWNMLPVNAVLLVIALFVAWGRFGPYAF